MIMLFCIYICKLGFACLHQVRALAEMLLLDEMRALDQVPTEGLEQARDKGLTSFSVIF